MVDLTESNDSLIRDVAHGNSIALKMYCQATTSHTLAFGDLGWCCCVSLGEAFEKKHFASLNGKLAREVC